MAKIKTKFVCSECGAEFPKWIGKCTECGKWSTLSEEKVEKERSLSERTLKNGGILSKPFILSEIKTISENRTSTGIKEMDRVLGGGIVPGSLVLVGGDPGIGKSTILLQLCDFSARLGMKVLYATGEESGSQIKMRASRLDVDSDNIYILAENNLESILGFCDELKPDLLVVDSIQTVYSDDLESAPGSVSQVREATHRLMKYAKSGDMATFIIGHVTKEGAIAGPRVLEHMVDTVLYFEGDSRMAYRILRAVKNRFGSTNELGIFRMGDKGLSCVDNPSEVLLSGRMKGVPGNCVVAAMEGTRAILVEVQALLVSTGYGVARRNTTGFDSNRAAMLMAVLEKRAGLQLSGYDSFVNAVGGIKVNEPASDLGVALALASSHREKAVSEDTMIIGEIGLAGEIRSVGFVENRVNEAYRMGFRRCILPKGNIKGLKGFDGMELIGVADLQEAMRAAFEK